jgi:hypothetical protein
VQEQGEGRKNKHVEIAKTQKNAEGRKLCKTNPRRPKAKAKAEGIGTI